MNEYYIITSASYDASSKVVRVYVRFNDTMSVSNTITIRAVKGSRVIVERTFSVPPHYPGFGTWFELEGVYPEPDGVMCSYRGEYCTYVFKEVVESQGVSKVQVVALVVSGVLLLFLLFLGLSKGGK